MKIRCLVAPDIRMFRLTVIGALLATLAASQVLAQAPAPAPAPAAATAAAAAPADELEDLVARIALYPDDLVAIILPASTNPLQIVQADRFLAKRKSDPKLPVDEKWDDAVKSLLNYPEVVTSMSGDLDWTAALGEAVVADQGNVLAAIQAFRRRTQAAGNLKSDSKQVVVVEKEVITIAPADPQVIYVPQYNPTAVVTYGYSAWGYYPSPYPVYYYPYAPGAAFATGLIWGAAIGAAWGGNHYHANYGGNANINIDRNTNINTGDRNVNRGNNAGGGQKWSSNKQPGQVSRSVGSTPPARVGDTGRGGGGASAGARPSTQGGAGTGAGAGREGAGGTRASTGAVGGAGAGAGAGASRESAGGSRSSSGAFDGYGSGRSASMDSARGASSRGASAGAGQRSAGGGRSGGGGGGRRR